MVADKAQTTRPRRPRRLGRRPVVASGSLADLHGPADGTVELPLHLFWSSPDRTFNLGERHDALAMYETVLGEAGSHDDLATYLNAGLLRALWPDLHLPVGTRKAWETVHPELRAARPSAA